MRHNFIDILTEADQKGDAMPSDDKPSKVQALKQSRTLNPHPERVADSRFAEEAFFDPRDLLQVKYEMVRRVQLEGRPLSRSAQDFGYSRPSLYAALEAFRDQGLAGLIPRPRGPKQAYKLTAELMQAVEQARLADPGLRTADLVALLDEQFGVRVHPRSLERALARQQKKRRPQSGPSQRRGS
jgi:transposase